MNATFLAILIAFTAPTTAPASQPAPTTAPATQIAPEATAEPRTPAQVAAAKVQAAKVANLERRIQQAEKRVEAARTEIGVIKASGISDQIARSQKRPGHKGGRRYYHDVACKGEAMSAAVKELDAAKDQLKALQAQLAATQDNQAE